MNRKFFAVAAMMLLMPLMMGAQTLKGSYFLDNSLNRNKLNPAFAPQSGYFQIPVIGNTSVGLLSNLDLQTFMYPMNGQLYTFLNKNVTMEQFEIAKQAGAEIIVSPTLEEDVIADTKAILTLMSLQISTLSTSASKAVKGDSGQWISA
mgnify:CR=1 FL=1